MKYIKLLEAAVEDARDVCKYLDAGMVEEAKAHTEFYWAALEKIRDIDEAEKVDRTNSCVTKMICRKTGENMPCNDCDETKKEPVAWMNKDGWIGLYKQGDATIPLYTAPPQREWDEAEKVEPVAIVNEGMGGIEWLDKPLPDDTPLYTAPPHREWVGLTDFEIRELEMKHFYFSATSSDTTSFAKEIEAILKERNT